MKLATALLALTSWLLKMINERPYWCTIEVEIKIQTTIAQPKIYCDRKATVKELNDFCF